jgi:hypothetical protein
VSVWFRVGFYRVLSKPDLPKSTRDSNFVTSRQRLHSTATGKFVNVVLILGADDLQLSQWVFYRITSIFLGISLEGLGHELL